MESTYTTDRLFLDELRTSDADFINKLVNTEGWLNFIGDRKVRTTEDAEAYIRKIMANPDITYWVVKLKNTDTGIGIITFIKRDYLEHSDIGFAFLPEYEKKGYALEASLVVLADAFNKKNAQILATTVKENHNSIKLLGKLGLEFYKDLEHGNDKLKVFEITHDKFLLTHLTNSFYSLFTNKNRKSPSFENINKICLNECIIIKQNNDAHETYNPDSFIKPRKEILSNGTLTEFEEFEYSHETKIDKNIAQRFSNYKKRGFLNGQYFEGSGTKLFQYIRTSNGWKISSLVWQDETIQ